MMCFRSRHMIAVSPLTLRTMRITVCKLHLQPALADMQRAVGMEPANAFWRSTMAETKCHIEDYQVHFCRFAAVQLVY